MFDTLRRRLKVSSGRGAKLLSVGLRHELDATGLTHDVTVEWDRIWIWSLLTVWDI